MALVVIGFNARKYVSHLYYFVHQGNDNLPLVFVKREFTSSPNTLSFLTDLSFIL